ncbi:GNAT family N-acetyltransferase [Sneathiella sp. HT1-7]|uniref:GNAT family N-acetyltransferase n=1 Tax=Sneathiella sp. HT1-7 TaxID=2887192 RepID=UPI001D13C23C|nr:GNAT family N-acetyltransferase [Sneathiella sp. HT1-7]MCC3305830.1 GNAT family N-acetyltransferase [Sneathiella sp. HT1-7]
MAELVVTRDYVRSDEIIALLDAHLTLMRSLSPPESTHALDLEGLRGSDITFWRAEIAGKLVGCGALKELADNAGEIKSMHTAAVHRGKGVAAALLLHVMATARERGYKKLFLETGSQPGFKPARQLYLNHGFTECPPFANYILDPNSVFMTINL